MLIRWQAQDLAKLRRCRSPRVMRHRMVCIDDVRAPLQPDGPLREATEAPGRRRSGTRRPLCELVRPELSNATASGEHVEYPDSRREACEGRGRGSVWVALGLGGE